MRGVNRSRKTDVIRRVSMRGDSRHMGRRAEEAAWDVDEGRGHVDAGKMRLKATRREVAQGWQNIAADLSWQDHPDLAVAVARFVATLPPARTEKEAIREALL